MTTRWCGPCEAWTDEPACWLCGDTGDDIRGDYRIVPARSWRGDEAAEWSPRLEAD